MMLFVDMQSARKRPSVEELMGHPWIAAHRPQDARPAASDAASQHTVQLPPPQPGALSTQALKKYTSMKEVSRHLHSSFFGCPIAGTSQHTVQLPPATRGADHTGPEEICLHEIGDQLTCALS